MGTGVRIELLTELFPLAMAIAANPPAVIAVVLMMSSAEARSAATWFVAGWLLGLVAVGAVVLAVADALGADAARSGPFVAIKGLVGIALIVLAAKKWLGRRAASDEGETPAWMARITGLSAAGAFGLAALFAGLNPKTLALNVAGAVVIAEVVPGTLGKAVTLAVFATVSSVTLLAPLVYGLAAPEHARDSLARLQRWLVVNNTAITAAVLAVLGVMVTASALRDLL